MIDFQKFREKNPRFSSVSDYQLESQYTISVYLLENIDKDSYSVEKYNLLIELMMCHLLTLQIRGDDVVGNITSVSAGSISTSFSGISLENEAWLNQSQYGMTLYQLIRKKNYAKYFA